MREAPGFSRAAKIIGPELQPLRCSARRGLGQRRHFTSSGKSDPSGKALVCPKPCALQNLRQVN
jgi:hypothetical protein